MPTEIATVPVGGLAEFAKEIHSAAQEINRDMPNVKAHYSNDFTSVELYRMVGKARRSLAQITVEIVDDKVKKITVVMAKKSPNYKYLREAILMGTAPWIQVDFP